MIKKKYKDDQFIPTQKRLNNFGDAFFIIGVVFMVTQVVYLFVEDGPVRWYKPIMFAAIGALFLITGLICKLVRKSKQETAYVGGKPKK